MIVKDKVDFVCPICLMSIKPNEDRILVTGPREDTIYYAHAEHSKQEDTDEGR